MGCEKNKTWCNTSVLGWFHQDILTALDQTWHPQHFFCAHCGCVFGSEGERAGWRWCRLQLEENSWKWFDSLRLTIKAATPIPVPGFMEKDGKAYCTEDFERLFSPRCAGCGQPVRQNYLSAANGTWHPECFVCAVSLLTSDHTHASLTHTQIHIHTHTQA